MLFRSLKAEWLVYFESIALIFRDKYTCLGGCCRDDRHHYSFFHGEDVDRPGNIRQDMYICLDKLERSIQNILATLA